MCRIPKHFMDDLETQFKAKYKDEMLREVHLAQRWLFIGIHIYILVCYVCVVN
jgi:hypothetical protein